MINQMLKDKLNKVLEFSKQNLVPILSILSIVSAGSTIYMYHQLSDLRENPQKAVQDETKRMVARVSELITLPEDEQPTIATVSNPDQLKDQPFFAKAKKGDKVLIYASAGKSILYDPVANKVLEVASMNVGASPTSTPSPTPTPKKGR